MNISIILLYLAGVPVITRGDGQDMSSLVGSSVLTALGLPELITYRWVGIGCILMLLKVI